MHSSTQQPSSTQRHIPRQWLRLSLALIVLGLANVPGTPRSADAAPLVLTPRAYLPSVIKSTLVAAAMANPSFEDQNWYTDYSHGGNQWPTGWTFYSPDAGQVMPFPTKQQEGSTVPAISGGQGEYIHKYQYQLPPEEYLGAPRGLILHGQLTYKAFSAVVPQALRLSQTLTGTPGSQLQVTGYILGETYDVPSGSNPKLEDDHFIGSVQLGSAADTRFYAAMIQRHEVPGNVRAWNRFVVTAPVPASGQLPLAVIVQQNWAGRTDFFIDNFSVVQFSN